MSWGYKLRIQFCIRKNKTYTQYPVTKIRVHAFMECKDHEQNDGNSTEDDRKVDLDYGK